MDNPSGALVGIHPVADLNQAELEKTDVDDISLEAVELYAVAHLERFARLDEKEPGHVGNRVMHGHGKAGAGQPQKRA